jgi:hypothetical protein
MGFMEVNRILLLKITKRSLDAVLLLEAPEDVLKSRCYIEVELLKTDFFVFLSVIIRVED